MLAAILLFGFLIRLISLNQSFWLDETAQAVLSRAPIFSVDYAKDFQPPLYYVLSHMWMMLGIREEWFLRLPSVIFAVLTIYLTYILGQKLFNKNTGLIAAAMLAGSPFHLYFSQEFRMYSLLTLLCLCLWITFLGKKWKTFSLLIALSVFTHYFAFINIIALGTYTLITDKNTAKKTFMYIAIGLAPFLLWIPTLHKQVITAHQLVSLWPQWSEVANTGFYKFLPLTIAKWTVGMISPTNKMLYAVSVGMFLVATGIPLIFSRKNLFLISYFVIPLMIAWLGGLWLPAATPARIQFVLPAMYLLVAQGIHILSQKKQLKSVAILAFSIIMMLHVGYSGIYLFDAKNHREDWRGAIAYTDDLIKKDEGTAMTIFEAKWAPMDWYSNVPQKYTGKSEPTSDNIILYTYLFEIFDPQQTVETSLQKDYTRIEEKDFRGVGIVKVFKRN